MKKYIGIVFILVISILTTGCWDKIEINQVIFPYSIGVDLNHGEGEKYIITISYPNINAIGKNATQKEMIYVVSTIASSVFEGVAELDTRLNSPFYFKHLRVLVLGNEVSKDKESVKKILDGMSRDFIINKKLRIVMSEGKAEDLLLFTIKAKRQNAIEGTIYTMLRKPKATARYPVQTLTGFIRDTDIGGVTLVPRVAVKDEDLTIFGACIFKDYEFVGYLDERENRIVTLLRDSVKADVIDVKYGDTTISYALDTSTSNKKLIKTEDGFKIRIDVEMEGALQEYILNEDPLDNNQDVLHLMEGAIETSIKNEVNRTLNLLQKEYKSDAIGIGEYISKFHPSIWTEISMDWDEIFSQILIDVNIDVKIRRRGLIQ